MNIGIVVEGDRDSAAYPELIRKIRDDIQEVYSIACGDAVRLKAKFVGFLKHFEWHAASFVDKALIIMDSDCSDPANWEAQLAQIYGQSHFTASFPVHFHATKCELETWLLADEDAITQVSQRRGKNRHVPAVPVQLESHRDAKELFHKTLSRAGLPADPQVYREIAELLAIGRVMARCPSFGDFVQKVQAC